MSGGSVWEIITADDGRIFIAEAGDIVCHTDPNHAADDRADVRRFRLIAAVPAMLAALKLQAAANVANKDHSVSFTDWREMDEAAAVAIVTAIAKAEGRS